MFNFRTVPPPHNNFNEDELLLFDPCLICGPLAISTVFPQQVEFRDGQCCEIWQHDLNSSGTTALGAVKLIHTELPDRQSLQHRALATVVSSNQ